MNKLYYATKLDKNGNKLTSSYTNEKGVIKYGGEDAVRQDTIFTVELNDDQTLNLVERGTGMPLRGMLINKGDVSKISSAGRYRLWAKLNNKWFETQFSFPAYGVANTSMKTMIGQYQAMLIVDTGTEPEDEATSSPHPEGLSVSDD